MLWRVGLCLLGAAAVASPLTWAMLWLQAPPRAALGAAVAAALAAALLWRRSAGTARALAWDGAQWWLHLPGEAEPRAGRVQLMIDLGAWLLLRFRPAPAARPAAASQWLALSQARQRPHWHALRCALQASAAAGVPGQGA